MSIPLRHKTRACGIFKHDRWLTFSIDTDMNTTMSNASTTSRDSSITDSGGHAVKIRGAPAVNMNSIMRRCIFVPSFTCQACTDRRPAALLASVQRRAAVLAPVPRCGVLCQCRASQDTTIGRGDTVSTEARSFQANLAARMQYEQCYKGRGAAAAAAAAAHTLPGGCVQSLCLCSSLLCPTGLESSCALSPFCQPLPL